MLPTIAHLFFHREEKRKSRIKEKGCSYPNGQTCDTDEVGTVSPDVFVVVGFYGVSDPDFSTNQQVLIRITLGYRYSNNFVHTQQVHPPPGIRLFQGHGADSLVKPPVCVPVNCHAGLGRADGLWRLDSCFTACHILEKNTSFAEGISIN